jgi:hypothetical protein
LENNIENLLSLFESVSLSDIENVSFMKRRDTKFLIRSSALPKILESIQENYKVLGIEGKNLFQYQSQYFDTPQLKFYHDHHNGKTKRIKVRIRNYVESKLNFLEIKQQDPKGHTEKSRMSIQGFYQTLPEVYEHFIKDQTTLDLVLSPTLQIKFKRFTLVNLEQMERITIDSNLSYVKDDDLKNIHHICIIELKQEKFNRASVLFQSLKKLGVRPTGFSKYCLGMIQLHPNIKSNAFKPNLLKIQKLST